MNKNKSVTCKCVDYYTENNNLYVKQKVINGVPTEMKCNNPVKGNQHFCEKHKNCKSFLKKFTTGDEPDFNPNLWGHPYVEGSHNCYAYFLDDIMTSLKKKCENICKKEEKGNCPTKPRKCRSLIPQPGDYDLFKKHGSLDKKTFKYDCKEMEQKIKSDNPIIRKVQLTDTCGKDMYKGAMVTDPGSTFHFYRQNKDGTWSHKPGTLKVSREDANGLPIYSPFTANRDYTKPNDKDPINYTGFCGYYCLPTKKKAKTYAK
jgi:hypothetical protein